MRLTGSRVGIARHCGWAFREDTIYPERPRGDGAAESNVLHAAIAGTLVGNTIILPYNLHAQYDVALNHLRQYGIENVRPEVSFAWDPATGKARRLGSMLDRKYEEAGALPHEICLSLDYLVVRDEDVVIGDWKAHFTSNVTPADDNAQLALGALCATQVYGVKAAKVEIVGLETTKAYVDDYYLRALELMTWDAEFRRVVKSIPGSIAVAGGHCTWCPALGACPETEKTIPATQLVKGAQPRWSTDALGLDNDIKMAQALPALEKAVEAVKESLQARYPNGLELDNGKIYKPITSKRRSFSKEKAVQILGHRAVECETQIEVTSWRQVNKK